MTRGLCAAQKPLEKPCRLKAILARCQEDRNALHSLQLPALRQPHSPQLLQLQIAERRLVPIRLRARQLIYPC